MFCSRLVAVVKRGVVSGTLTGLCAACSLKMCLCYDTSVTLLVRCDALIVVLSGCAVCNLHGMLTHRSVVICLLTTTDTNERRQTK